MEHQHQRLGEDLRRSDRTETVDSRRLKEPPAQPTTPRHGFRIKCGMTEGEVVTEGQGAIARGTAGEEREAR